MVETYSVPFPPSLLSCVRIKNYVLAFSMGSRFQYRQWAYEMEVS